LAGRVSDTTTINPAFAESQSDLVDLLIENDHYGANGR
jgi:hypothetical protein